jgi:hypothetical protein
LAFQWEAKREWERNKIQIVFKVKLSLSAASHVCVEQRDRQTVASLSVLFFNPFQIMVLIASEEKAEFDSLSHFA